MLSANVSHLKGRDQSTRNEEGGVNVKQLSAHQPGTKGKPLCEYKDV